MPLVFVPAAAVATHLFLLLRHLGIFLSGEWAC
jgi:hypothetical protein